MSEKKPMKRRKRKKKVIILSVAGVLVVAGVGGGLYWKQNSKKEMPSVTVEAQSATASLGTISNTIVGTGNLSLSDAEAQNLPSGIEVDEVKVESGDHVEEGDVIATVNKASVLSAIEETQSQIDALDEQIHEDQDSSSQTISSSVDGRVKRIFVEAGDDIADVMLENGALMVLSLDGKMAVDLTGTTLAKDDTVTITLSSGTQVTGTVAEVSGDTCTITLTDNGTEYDDTVTVTDSDGNELGSGNLYIHEPLEVTGTSGVVKALKVSSGSKVSSGTALLTLTDSTDTIAYQELLAQREALLSTLQKLLALSKDQTITASISGTVQSVNVSASSSVGSSSSSESSSTTGISAQKMSAKSTGSVQASTMSCRTTTGASYMTTTNLLMTSSEENMVSDVQDEGVMSDAVMSSDFGDGTDSSSGNEAGNSAGGETPQKTTISLQIVGSGQSSSNTLVIPAPETAGTPVTSVTAADGSYTGTISWNPQGDSFQGGAVYQSVVTLVAADGYQFQEGSILALQTGVLSGLTISGDGSQISFTITWPQTQAIDMVDPDENTDPTDTDTTDNNANGQDTQNQANNNQNNNNQNNQQNIGGDSNNSENNGNNSNNNGASITDGQTNGQTDNNQQNSTSDGSDSELSGLLSGSGSSAGGSYSAGTDTATTSASQSSTAATTTSLSYSTDVEAFTISPDDSMVLSVSVDELDINSVELGQEATVTLDAIEDEEFTGEVTDISDTASASGGVAKYSVSLSIPKDSRMKQGMNASATITIESRENVITIPVNALQERGSEVFVYTEQAEDGTLSGEQQVTTGLSDGSTVEITEGLSEGDTVYYNKTGSTQSSTDFSDFGGGDFSGGNAPDNMPSGGGNGGGGNGGGPGNMPNM